MRSNKIPNGLTLSASILFAFTLLKIAVTKHIANKYINNICQCLNYYLT